MKREYKITKSDLWYKIFREKEEDWIKEVERLQNNSYTLNRDHAKLFVNLDNAISNLVIARRKWDTIGIISNEKEELLDTKEKQLWSEF